MAFICWLHSHQYLITAFVVNKCEQSAKKCNKKNYKVQQIVTWVENAFLFFFRFFEDSWTGSETVKE